MKLAFKYKIDERLKYFKWEMNHQFYCNRNTQKAQTRIWIKKFLKKINILTQKKPKQSFTSLAIKQKRSISRSEKKIRRKKYAFQKAVKKHNHQYLLDLRK